MSDEVDELIEEFLSLCLEQRQVIRSGRVDKEEELKLASLKLAKKMYTKAAEFERSGDITKAIELYNRAYRLDPEIDTHIDRDRLASEISQRDLSELEPYYKPFKKFLLQNCPVDQELFSIILKAKMINDSAISISNHPFAKVLSFPLKDGNVDMLKDLPNDVLDKILGILGWMHIPSLEVTSMASRDLFLACRQESLWKFLYEKCVGSSELELNSSWRLKYIMSSHFRTDGLYISKITYLRQGYQESAICQPSHLVTYYRYLRFYDTPEIKGRLVVALVSTEKPESVIDKLRVIDERTLQAIKERMFPVNCENNAKLRVNRFKSKEPDNYKYNSVQPNLFIGTFKVESDRKYKLILFDAHSKHPMRLKMILELLDPLKGIPAYKAAKCLEYSGRVERNNGDWGDKMEFDIKNWGKFYFSAIKSYK